MKAPSYLLKFDYTYKDKFCSFHGRKEGINLSIDLVLKFTNEYIQRFNSRALVLEKLASEYEEFMLNCEQTANLNTDEKYKFYDSLSNSEQKDLFMRFYDQLEKETLDYIAENLDEYDQIEHMFFIGRVEKFFTIKVKNMPVDYNRIF